MLVVKNEIIEITIKIIDKNEKLIFSKKTFAYPIKIGIMNINNKIIFIRKVLKKIQETIIVGEIGKVIKKLIMLFIRKNLLIVVNIMLTIANQISIIIDVCNIYNAVNLPKTPVDLKNEKIIKVEK